MGVHLLHTADLQLGKTFGRFPPDVAAVLRAARLETLARIARLAAGREVDAVLVAGDCFDDVAVADETLRRFLVALEPFAGRWILLPGNHDPAIAESPWQRLRRLGLPDNVTVADVPEPLSLGDDAVVLPAPLRRRRDAADLTEWFDAAPSGEGTIRIGLAHGSVRELLPDASEAANPVALDRAQRARLDYLALGDWHGRLRLGERTWYSGTPEPDRFRANDPGSVLDVRIAAPGAPPQVEALPVARYEWRLREAEVMPGDDTGLQALLTAEGVALAHLVLRLRLRGTVDLATRAAVTRTLADLGARVLHLDTDDGELRVEPTEADLDAVETTGFVREAMDALRRQAAGEDGDTARRALALLYGIHQSRSA